LAQLFYIKSIGVFNLEACLKIRLLINLKLLVME